MKENAFTKFLVRNRNPIMVGVGIAGISISEGLIVYRTIQAVREIDRIEAKTGKKLSKKDIIRLVWKRYIAPLGMTFGAFMSIIFAMKDEHAKAVTSALACSMSEAAFREFKDKAKEIVGDKKEHEIQDAVSKEKVKEVMTQNTPVIVTGKGTVLFLEPITHTPFESDWNAVQSTLNEFNKDLQHEMRFSMNDWLTYLNLPLMDERVGSRIGWDIENGLLDIYFSTQLTEDNRPCVVLNYERAPEMFR